MSKTPNYDAKVKAMLDSEVPCERTCSRTGDKWKLEEREIEWCKKFNVPISTISPDNRMMTLAAFLFGYEWWWNKHAETGEPLLTYVHPSTGVKVLPDVEWFEKDYRDKGIEHDASKKILEHIFELRKEVPINAFYNVKEPKNSIALISDGDVNSYFMIACKGKNSFYSSDLFDGELSTEVYAGKNITNSVNVVHAQRIHNSRYVRESLDCSNCAFIFDCRNCEFCFGATNKRNKKFIFMNEQLTEEEYKKRMSEIDLSCRSKWEGYVEQFKNLMEKDGVWPENFNEKVENCTGEYLTNCTNCVDCFMGWEGSKDSERCFYLFNSSEIYYVVGSFYPSESYMSAAVAESNKCKFSINLLRSQNLEYCLNCSNCENCFGCVGLSRQKFCIFNKQYEEEEYWRALDEIKCKMLEEGTYGDIFTGDFCTSHFMETAANESLGAVDEDAARLGFPIFERESAGAIGELGNVKELTNSSEVPDCIDALEVSEWAGKAMFDDVTGRRFAFLKPELEYYKEYRVAPPTKHFMRRVDELYWAANDYVTIQVKCNECSKDLNVMQNRTYKNRKHLCRPCYLKYLETNG